MQTTLLGLAIAFIVTLTAALIGPHFIDWNAFRPQFEAEASRVLGTAVRVDGQMNAQILPAPTLTLQGIVVGGANDPGKFRTDRLNVEFSLGSLMRGEWRATELTINGLSVDMGFDRSGRLDFPVKTENLNLGALAIDRLNVTGRLALHDAASRSTTELNDIVFSGDVRALASSMRGSGNFSYAGQRYPFRLSSGATSDNIGTRVHFNVDPGQTAMAIDVDGVVTFDQRIPQFDGGLTVARVVNTKAAAADVEPAAMRPWRLAARVKADPSAAQLEQVDGSFGAEDAALKFSGQIDITFGLFPALRAQLNARPFDADRLWQLNPGLEQSSLLPQVMAVLSDVPLPPLKSRIEVTAEQIMLGGRPVQKLEADVRSDGPVWNLQRLDLRAPGATRLTLAGDQVGNGEFKGIVALDSTDPDTLSNWLQGRSETAALSQQPLRVRGQVAASPGLVTIDGLRADVDGSALTGRVVMADVRASGGARVEAEIQAERLDIDAFAGLLRGFVGSSKKDWPVRGRLALNIGTAISAGQELKPFIAAVRYSPESISLDRFRVGDLSGLMLDGDGAFNRLDASGKLVLSARAASLGHLANLVKPMAPDFAGRLEPMAREQGAVALNLKLDVKKTADKPDETAATLVLDVASPQLNGVVNLGAKTATTTLDRLDLAAIIQSQLDLSADLSSKHGQSLIGLVGLDRWIAGGSAPLRFEGRASGRLQAPLDVSAKLTGAAVDGGVTGRLDLTGHEPKLDLALNVRQADVSPVLGGTASVQARPIRLTSKVGLVAGKLQFDDIDSTIAGTRLRGTISVQSGAERVVNGKLGLDVIEVAPLVGMLIGARPGDNTQPLSPALSGWRGEVAIQAIRAVLPGDIEIKPLSAALVGRGSSIGLTKLKGTLAGGEATGDVNVSQGADGVRMDVQAEVKNADGTALRYQSLAMPAGKVSLKLALASTGRSVAALEGSTEGEGVLTITDAKLAGLNPAIFEAAIKAVDNETGARLNEERLRELVHQQMQQGVWPVKQLQIPFVAKDGRIRVSAIALDAEASKATLSGGYDMSAGEYDLRVSVIGKPPAHPGSPEVLIFTGGVPSKSSTTVDTSGLSAWLALRAIERETKRLEALQRDEALATAVGPTDRNPPSNMPASSAKPADAAAATSPSGSGAPQGAAVAADEAAPSALATDPHLEPAIPNPPLPMADPRRASSAGHSQANGRHSETEALSNVPAPSGQIKPLPAPIEVKPAPEIGSAPHPRPATPMVLTPSKPAGAARTTF